MTLRILLLVLLNRYKKGRKESLFLYLSDCSQQPRDFLVSGSIAKEVENEK